MEGGGELFIVVVVCEHSISSKTNEQFDLIFI